MIIKNDFFIRFWAILTVRTYLYNVQASKMNSLDRLLPKKLNFGSVGKKVSFFSSQIINALSIYYCQEAEFKN